MTAQARQEWAARIRAQFDALRAAEEAQTTPFYIRAREAAAAAKEA